MNQIEEIKSKIDIVGFISEFLPLQKAGRNFKTCCPFHSEKTPSFMVSPELQIFKCFGCGISGDAIKFLQLYEKMDFWEAVEFLAKRVGIKLLRQKPTGEEQIKKRIYEINHLACEFYHFLLTKHKLGEKAKEYLLKERKINQESIRNFKIGFSPQKLGAVADFLKKKGYSREELVKAGLVLITKEGNSWDRFSGRLVFPLFDHRGNIVGFSGRIIPGFFLKEEAKYVNSPETVVYHKGSNLYGLWLTKGEISKKNEAIVVEGEFDLILPYQAGIKNIVAIKGTAFTLDQAKLLKRFAETAVFSLDNDPAGVEAVKKSIAVAEPLELNLKVAVLPKGVKDPDDLVKKDPQKLTEVFAKAIPAWDFLIDSAVAKYGVNDYLKRKKIVQEILPFLVLIESEVTLNFYFKKIAGILGISVEAIIAEVERFKKKKVNLSKLEVPEEKVLIDKGVLLEKYLLSLIFLKRDWSWFKKKKLLSLISFPPYLKVVLLAKKFFEKEEKKKTAGDFLKFLPEELKNIFQDLYLVAEEESKIVSEEDGEKISEVMKRVENYKLRRRLSEIAQEIAVSEFKKQKEKIKKLEKEFVEISKRLAN